MLTDCPKGWINVTQLGNLTFKDSRVNICGEICDSPDLCGITDCEYYDDTREGTRNFQRALAHEDTREGMIEKIRAEKRKNG